LRENLEMTVKEAMGLVKQKFPIVQQNYNKLWREKKLAIVDIFYSWERSYEMLSTTKADRGQMNSRMIADIVKK
jgi:hypothetical protein